MSIVIKVPYTGQQFIPMPYGSVKYGMAVAGAVSTPYMAWSQTNTGPVVLLEKPRYGTQHIEFVCESYGGYAVTPQIYELNASSPVIGETFKAVLHYPAPIEADNDYAVRIEEISEASIYVGEQLMQTVTAAPFQFEFTIPNLPMLNMTAVITDKNGDKSAATYFNYPTFTRTAGPIITNLRRTETELLFTIVPQEQTTIMDLGAVDFAQISYYGSTPIAGTPGVAQNISLQSDGTFVSVDPTATVLASGYLFGDELDITTIQFRNQSNDLYGSTPKYNLADIPTV